MSLFKSFLTSFPDHEINAPFNKLEDKEADEFLKSLPGILSPRETRAEVLNL